MKNLFYLLLILLLVACNKNNITPKKTDKDVTPDRGEIEASTCIQTCYQDYRALKKKNNKKDFLAFKNFGHRGIGRCRGHSIVNQKLVELVDFKKSKDPLCEENYNSLECKEKIRKKIKNVMNFKVETIEGFSNLYDFSSTPYIKELLKSYVRGISNRYRATRAHMRDESLSGDEKVFREVLWRIHERQRPYIGVYSSSVGDHSLIAYDVEYKDSLQVLCVHDPNIILVEEEDQCENYLFFKEGSVFYKRINKAVSKLIRFNLFSDEDERVRKYIIARYQQCVNTKCLVEN